MPKNLDYATVYYDAALAFLQVAKQRFLPEHTETDPYDPINAILRITAVRMHRDAALIDRVAEELYWPSFRTRAGAIALSRLLGYRLRRHTPAQVDVVAALTDLLSVPELLVSAGTRISTLGDGDTAAVHFETDADISSDKTSFAGAADDSGDVFVWNKTLGTFADWNPAQNADLYAGGALGDAVYFGHPDLMFKRLTLALSALASVEGVWEYRDETFVVNPGPSGAGGDAAVQDLGAGALSFRLDGYAGSADLSDGVWTVEVSCLATGQSEDCLVEWSVGDSRNFCDSTSYLGQSSPSLLPSAYEIRPLWVIPSGLTDATNDGTGPGELAGAVSFTLPQTRDTHLERAREWSKTPINGTDAFWLRLRRCGTAGAGTSQLDGVTSATAADWYALLQAKQGHTISEVIGQADGTAHQRYALGSDEYAEGSLEVTLGSAVWAAVDSLFQSDPSDRVFTLVEDTDGTLYAEFGDGVNGLIPTGGGDLVAAYRTGISQSGNAGAESVVNLSQAGSLTGQTNPRAASGWQQREGHDIADLERLRRWVPGWARVGLKIVTPEDASYHALSFVTADGRSPIGRGDSVEDASDVQVLTVWVRSPGGGALAASDITAAETYLNGTVIGDQRIGGLMLGNQRAEVQNASLRTVNIAATVTVLSGFDGDVEVLVTTALKDFLGPMATDSAGNFIHRVGGKVSYGRTGSVIDKAVVEGLSDYTYSFTGEVDPLASVDLAAGELPTVGTVSITVVAVTSE